MPEWMPVAPAWGAGCKSIALGMEGCAGTGGRSYRAAGQNPASRVKNAEPDSCHDRQGPCAQPSRVASFRVCRMAMVALFRSGRSDRHGRLVRGAFAIEKMVPAKDALGLHSVRLMKRSDRKGEKAPAGSRQKGTTGHQQRMQDPPVRRFVTGLMLGGHVSILREHGWLSRWLKYSAIRLRRAPRFHPNRRTGAAGVN
jgi:hypothetical protein